jgi:8-oxo-dGTP pyrophosphatase MutT (NUDIX family)
MKITRRELAFEGKYLRIVNKYFRTKAGKEGTWETVTRTNVYNRGAVVIVALTKERELILERNWRVPLESFVLQFPAGLTDREWESEEETARRELLEETGYLATRLIPIITAPLSPALSPTGASHFLAPDVEYAGRRDTDDPAETEVIKVPVAKISDFILHLDQDTKLDLRLPGILWILERTKLI